MNRTVLSRERARFVIWRLAMRRLLWDTPEHTAVIDQSSSPWGSPVGPRWWFGTRRHSEIRWLWDYGTLSSPSERTRPLRSSCDSLPPLLRDGGGAVMAAGGVPGAAFATGCAAGQPGDKTAMGERHEPKRDHDRACRQSKQREDHRFQRTDRQQAENW